MFELGATSNYDIDSLRRYRHFSKMDFCVEESDRQGQKIITTHKWLLQPLTQHGGQGKKHKCEQQVIKRKNGEWML
jgi:hypothetical protein